MQLRRGFFLGSLLLGSTISEALFGGGGARLVALDMDGTALNRDHQLSATTIDTLRDLSARGMLVALCSGRSNAAIQAHATELALQRSLPIVSFNGACGLLAEGPGWTDGGV